MYNAFKPLNKIEKNSKMFSNETNRFLDGTPINKKIKNKNQKTIVSD